MNGVIPIYYWMCKVMSFLICNQRNSGKIFIKKSCLGKPFFVHRILCLKSQGKDENRLRQS